MILLAVKLVVKIIIIIIIIILFQVGHDGVTPQEGWFLEDVEVDMPTLGKHYSFPCKRWLSKDKDDGHISRVLVIDDAQSATYKPSKYMLVCP